VEDYSASKQGKKNFLETALQKDGPRQLAHWLQAVRTISNQASKQLRQCCKICLLLGSPASSNATGGFLNYDEYQVTLTSYLHGVEK